jgi:uncharacterized membrane protein YjfL (UPF0719 family)
MVDMGALTNIGASLVAALLQLVLGLVLAMGSVYIGLKMFDKLTKGIDEWKEIKKGNVAVGILMAAVILSIANVVQTGVQSITMSIVTTEGLMVVMVGLLVGMLNLLIGLAAAIVSIFIAITVLDKITTDIDETKELEKGNVAVAVIMAGVLIAVSFLIGAAVMGLSKALDPITIVKALGL